MTKSPRSTAPLFRNGILVQLRGCAKFYLARREQCPDIETSSMMIVSTIRDVNMSATEEKQWEVMTNHLFVVTRPTDVQTTTEGALASEPNIKTTNHATVKTRTDCETIGDAARSTMFGVI